MPQKRIDPDKIKSVTASYEDMSEYLTKSVDFIGTGDASSEKLKATTDKISAISQNISTKVESMDSYLNTVAVVFHETDAKLASSIDSGFETHRVSDKNLRPQHKQRDIVKQQNPYYPNLP